MKLNTPNQERGSKMGFTLTQADLDSSGYEFKNGFEAQFEALAKQDPTVIAKVWGDTPETEIEYQTGLLFDSNKLEHQNLSPRARRIHAEIYAASNILMYAENTGQTVLTANLFF